jgi:RNA polymerase sigma-70 factor, ECF subfamily
VTDEQAWILQAQHGSDEAFTALVEHYQQPVYNLCYRMLDEAQAAEDAAQETFLRLYQNLWRYDRNRPFATWLLSIAAHYCIDRLRRSRLPAFSMDDDESAYGDLPDRSAPNPETEAVRSQERERLHGLLACLDATDRAAVVLRYWHHLSEAEVAEALSLTPSAVKSRLHRARRALGRMWQEETPSASLERIAHGSPAF